MVKSSFLIKTVDFFVGFNMFQPLVSHVCFNGYQRLSDPFLKPVTTTGGAVFFASSLRHLRPLRPRGLVEAEALKWGAGIPVYPPRGGKLMIM